MAGKKYLYVDLHVCGIKKKTTEEIHVRIIQDDGLDDCYRTVLTEVN